MLDKLPHMLCDQVSADRMMDILTELQRWEKLSGSADELTSLTYVEKVISGFGYRTEILMHDAYISLPGAARLHVGGRDISCITHSHSFSSGPAGLCAEIVDLGAGGETTFAHADLSGKIVLVDGLASPDIAERARRAGAAGQIHVTQDDHIHEMCISPVWGSPSAETLNGMPTTVVVTISRQDGAALRARMTDTSGLTATIFAEVDTGWRKTPILIADMYAPGRSEDDPFILFSGHHDTWYFGVMDNGSANATMLETARLTASRRDDWQRNLRFAFWSGHSHGRYSGSAWYADNHWDEMERNCVAHVNTDSTGGCGANILTGSGCASELRGVAVTAIRDQGNQDYEGKRFGRQGDESFWGIGVPSIFNSLSHHAADVGAGHGTPKLGWWWHTEHDTLDKIDPENLARDTRIFVQVVSELLLRPVLPLDYTAQATDLVACLDRLQARLGDRFDLTPFKTQAETFGTAAARLCVRAEASDDATEIARINRTLIRISRELVPMDYTRGDRFVHDPALAQPEWPVLMPVLALAELPKDDPAIPFHMISARRAVNRLSYALRRARELAEAHI